MGRSVHIICIAHAGMMTISNAPACCSQPHRVGCEDSCCTDDRQTAGEAGTVGSTACRAYTCVDLSSAAVIHYPEILHHLLLLKKAAPSCANTLFS